MSGWLGRKKNVLRRCAGSGLGRGAVITAPRPEAVFPTKGDILRSPFPTDRVLTIDGGQAHPSVVKVKP